jgi:hypothetical protein
MTASMPKNKSSFSSDFLNNQRPAFPTICEFNIYNRAHHRENRPLGFCNSIFRFAETYEQKV